MPAGAPLVCCAAGSKAAFYSAFAGKEGKSSPAQGMLSVKNGNSPPENGNSPLIRKRGCGYNKHIIR